MCYLINRRELGAETEDGCAPNGRIMAFPCESCYSLRNFLLRQKRKQKKWRKTSRKQLFSNRVTKNGGRRQKSTLEGKSIHRARKAEIDGVCVSRRSRLEHCLRKSSQSREMTMTGRKRKRIARDGAQCAVHPLFC